MFRFIHFYAAHAHRCVHQTIHAFTQMQGSQGQLLSHLINNRELRQMTGSEAEHHPLKLSLKHHTRTTHKHTYTPVGCHNLDDHVTES